MKKLLKNYQDSLININLTKQELLFEGLLLIFTTILALVFNLNPCTLTIYYLFPISIISLGIFKLYYANKDKELDTKKWIIIVCEGIIYLIAALLLVIFPLENPSNFIYCFSTLLIFYNIIKLFINNKSTILIVNVIVLLALNILSIIFNNFILDNLYLYFLLIYLIYGIKKLILYAI